MTNLTSDNGAVLFAHDELASPDTGKVGLAAGFAGRLKDLRQAFGEPMVVTSACRSRVYNEQIGGHPRSLHVYDQPHHDVSGCAAIDVLTTDSTYRARLVATALDFGWSVGIGDGFVHLDRRDLGDVGPQVLFTYY